MIDTATLTLSDGQLADRLVSNAETVREAYKRYGALKKSTRNASTAYLVDYQKKLNEAFQQAKALNRAYSEGVEVPVTMIEAAEQATQEVLQLEAKGPERRPSLYAKIAKKRTERHIKSSLSEAGWYLEHIQDALEKALDTTASNGTERLRARSVFWNSVSLDPDLSRAIDSTIESVAHDEAAHTRGVRVFKTELARLSNASAMATTNGIEKLFGTPESAPATA